MSIFRVWYNEPKGDVGAVGGGQPQCQVTPLRTQQQKLSVGRVSGRGNYDFFFVRIKQHGNKISHRELKDESMG